MKTFNRIMYAVTVLLSVSCLLVISWMILNVDPVHGFVWPLWMDCEHNPVCVSWPSTPTQHDVWPALLQAVDAASVDA